MKPRKVKRGIAKGRVDVFMAGKGKSKLVIPQEVVILEQGEDLENLFNLFGVTDESDIRGVVDGSVGEFNEDW
jgi:hypothetical protein